MMLAFSPESASLEVKVARGSLTRTGRGVKVVEVGVITGQLSLTSDIVTWEWRQNILNI